MNTKKPKTTKAKTPEDLAVLSRTYSLGTISYVNITQQEQLKQILEHWPLFAELAKGKSTSCP